VFSGEGSTTAQMYLRKSRFDEDEIQECVYSLRDWRLDNTVKSCLKVVVWRSSINAGTETTPHSRNVIE
jgi:hypothetical protein